MNTAKLLLGIYVPGDSWWHRAPVGVKYLVFLALVLPAVVLASLPLAAVLLVAALAATASTGAPLRLAWGLPGTIVVLLALLGGYHVWAGHPELGATIVAAMLTAVYASRLLLLSTPGPVLIDALVAAARPARRLGLDPERFGLAVAIMVRSIPYVAGAFGDVRQAARARGLERNPLALVAPVVVQTVAYARTTGDALAARGLGEADGDAGDLDSAG